MTYRFDEQLAFSKQSTRQRTDAETIKAMIDDCVSVVEASEKQDRQGIDYIATLSSGVELYIDTKTRDVGCSQYWTVMPDKSLMPELALEDWSAIPENGGRGRIGWTLDANKRTHLVLFTFDPSDTTKCYLVSFQLLRMAFKRNLDTWRKDYKGAPQDNPGWTSHCIFVPVRVVFKAILEVCCGVIVQPTAQPVPVMN